VTFPAKVVEMCLHRADRICPVCGGRWDIDEPYYVPGGAGYSHAVRVWVRCHGSKAVFDVQIDRGAREPERHLATQVFDFMDRAFRDEAKSADLREVLAYNRGALPAAK
jgi:hypothetical protein